MPILQYLFGVGGALLCMMFVLNAYVPAAPLREQREIDKSIIHVNAPLTGDFMIDHFPAVRGDLADAANDAVKKAMAMMPPEDVRPAASKEARTEPPPNSARRKRRVAQRPQSRLASGDGPSPTRSQIPSNQAWSSPTSPNGEWPTGNWSQGWSNNSGNWNSGRSRGWANNGWADNQ